MRAAVAALFVACLAATPALGAKGVLIFGGENDQHLKPYWLDGVHHAYASMTSALGAQNVTVYFHGDDTDLQRAGVTGAAHLVRGVTGKPIDVDQMTSAIVSLANGDDVILFVFGHGIFRLGAVDVIGGKAFGPSAVMKQKNQNHRLLVVHTACYGGGQWDFKPSAMPKTVAFTFASGNTPADGEVALAMTRWLADALFSGKASSGMDAPLDRETVFELFALEFQQRCEKEYHQRNESDAVSYDKDYQSFKSSIAKLKTTNAKGYVQKKIEWRELHAPRSCNVYPRLEDYDVTMRTVLPSRF